MTGITAYGSYLPQNELDLAEVGRVLSTPGGRGVRAVAGADEDTTTMAVAAGTTLAPGRRAEASSLWFATSDPAYAGKLNAATIHAALRLPPSTAASDLGPAVASGAAAFRAAAASGGLAVLADQWSGRPASSEELAGGAGAAAFLFGDEDPVAELIGTAAVTRELLDRWRLPDQAYDRTWDERFAGEVLLPAAQKAITQLPDDVTVDHLVVAAPNARVARAAVKLAPDAELAGPPPGSVGYAGSASLGLGVADALDRAEPGDVILALSMADGVEAFLLRATEHLADRRAPVTVRAQCEGRRTVDYATFLTWAGELVRQPPRRPEPQAPAAPPAVRSSAWKFALVGGRCRSCGAIEAPPQPRCRACGSVEIREEAPLADTSGRIISFTVDHLAYTLDPPVLVAVIDTDNGARLTMEVTDADPEELEVGGRVKFTFRRLFTAENVHDYFWKARPVGSGNGAEEAHDGQ